MDLPTGPAAVAAKLSALAHPARIEILQHLSRSGCCCCKDVVDQMDLAQSTVSQHLKILVETGLVRYTPDRQRSMYEIDRAEISTLASTLDGILRACCDGPTKTKDCS